MFWLSVVGLLTLAAWPPTPSEQSPLLDTVQAFLATRTATRLHPASMLFTRHLSSPPSNQGSAAAAAAAAAVEELTDATYTAAMEAAQSKNVTWLVHAYTPFDLEAQRVNALLEKEMGRRFARRAAARVRVGKVDVTVQREAARQVVRGDDSFRCSLTVVPAGDVGRSEEFRGPRTRQGLGALLDHLQQAEASSSPSTPPQVSVPTHLTKHKDVKAFLGEHPLAFVLGRVDKADGSTEEEAVFATTCEALGWQHCAVAHDKKSLLRAASASLTENLGLNHQGHVIAKLEQGRDALVYHPSPALPLENWMVEHGFPLLAHLELAGPHVQRFLEHGRGQLVLAVVYPLQDSVDAIEARMEALTHAARHHPSLRFGYVATEAKAWHNFLATQQEGVEKKAPVPSSTSRLYLLDAKTRQLYADNKAGIDAFLQDCEAGALTPLLTLLPQQPSQEAQQQQEKEAAAVDEDAPVAPAVVRRLFLETLASIALAVLVVVLLLVTPQSLFAKKEETKMEEEEAQQQVKQQTQTPPKTSPVAGAGKLRQQAISESLD